MKPKLPPEIEAIFPGDVLSRIYSFVPHLPKTPKTVPASPQMEKDLRSIQSKGLGGTNAMYLKELDDFILDVREPGKKAK